MPSTEGLKWFYGAGAYLGFDSDKTNTDRALMGAQGIIGLDYKFANLPLNLSLDWKPELNIIDNINFEPAAVGSPFDLLLANPKLKLFRSNTTLYISFINPESLQHFRVLFCLLLNCVFFVR